MVLCGYERWIRDFSEVELTDIDDGWDLGLHGF